MSKYIGTAPPSTAAEHFNSVATGSEKAYTREKESEEQFTSNGLVNYLEWLAT